MFKIGSVFKIVPKEKNDEFKYKGIADDFNMIKLINDIQNQCYEETVECGCIEYNKLLREKPLAASNPQFYHRVRNIFEAIFDNPHYNHDGDAYYLLVYFVIEYVHPYDIEIESDEITLVARYSNEHDFSFLSILNLLLTNYKQMLMIKKIKPFDILAELRVKL